MLLGFGFAEIGAQAGVIFVGDNVSPSEVLVHQIPVGVMAFGEGGYFFCREMADTLVSTLDVISPR